MRPTLRPPWTKQTFLLRWHPRAPQSIPRRIATTSATNPAPTDFPKLVISPGSASHNSLPTFLEYAKRTKLAPETPYYVGTHYEYTSGLSLMRLGFSLLRVGRKSDAGIDLIGHWALGALREPMRVIIQCKARDASVTPSNVRELEGSFQGIPPNWKNQDVLALLVTTKRATKGVLATIGQSGWPMGFVMVSRAGTIQQFVWNRAASARGLEGVGVTIRHTPRVLLPSSKEVDQEDGEVAKPVKKSRAKFKDAGTKKDIQLTWMGSPVFPDRKLLDQDTLKLMHVIEATAEDQETRLRKESLHKLNSGRLKTEFRLPAPRGGVLPIKSSTTKSRPPNLGRPEEPPKAKPGRPKGSKNKPKRGRPPGSKNKPKVEADAI